VTNQNIITVQGERIILDKDRHIRELEAKLAAAKDPWIYIDQERPETLPETSFGGESDHVLLWVVDTILDADYDFVIVAWLEGGNWVEKGEGYLDTVYGRGTIKPYAWQPWPDPAPQKEPQ
jgi:hypothetical protein